MARGLFSSVLLTLAVILLLILGYVKVILGYHPFNGLVHLMVDEKGQTVKEEEMTDLSVSHVIWNGNLQAPALNELSGLAESTTYPGVFYGINDSGGQAELYLLDSSGGHLGSVSLNLPKPRDWEAITAFRQGQESYLMIADTGDNLRWHPYSRLHIVKEPLLMDGKPDNTNLDVVGTLHFRFADGPRDCEGIAVDMRSASVFLVSKRTIPPVVYRLPIDFEAFDVQSDKENEKEILEALPYAKLVGIPQPVPLDLRQDPEYGKYRSMVTDFDILDRKAIVITYKHAYLYEREGDSSWEETFSALPQRILLPPTTGREAGVLLSTGHQLLVSGERLDGVSAQAIYLVDW